MDKSRSRSRFPLGLATALPLTALFASPPVRAQAFPDSFAPLYCGRGLMTDGYRDQSGAVDERDIVGTPAQPAAFRAIDGQFLYLRLRLDAAPTQGQGLTPFAWGFVISTDGDPTDYEILIAADGGNDTVVLYRNTTTTVPDSPADPAEELVASYPFAQNGRVIDAGPSLFGGGNDTFLDLAVPWSALAGLGLAPGTLVTIWAASSTNADRLNGDFACHEGGGGTIVPSLSSVAPAPLTPDPASSPGPTGASGEGGNVVGASGLEGGPGCDCRAAGRDSGGDRWPLADLLLALFSVRRLRGRNARPRSASPRRPSLIS